MPITTNVLKKSMNYLISPANDHLIIIDGMVFTIFFYQKTITIFVITQKFIVHSNLDDNGIL